MRSTLLLFCLLLFGICSWSQTSITIQVPPTGIMLKPQLWNIIVINASSSRQVKINLTLTDLISGQVVMTGTTSSFLLNNGTKHITSSDVNIQYDYPSPLINDHDPNGYLTIGTFDACYTLSDEYSSHGDVTTLTECTNVIVEPINPPLLAMPCDECYAESAAPLFNWLPPAPINLFTNLSYEIKLVEISPGQASSEAIETNAPVLIQKGISDLFLSYPASGTFLDTSKTYAWQVVAKNNNQYAAQSEIWTFKLRPPLISQIPEDSANYLVLKEANLFDGTAEITGDWLKLKYYSFSSNKSLILFKDENNKAVYQTEKNINYGNNFLLLPIPKILKKGKIYSAEIVSQGNDKSTIYFTRK